MPASPPLRLARLVTLAAATVTLAAGCGGTADEPRVSVTESPAAASQESPPSSAATPTESPAEEPTDDATAAPEGPTVVEVTVAGGSVSTAASRVEVGVGTPVRLVVTSDTADELHVHGVDVEVPLAAGVPAVLDFVPEEPGVYDAETHDTHLLLVQIVAR